MYDVLKLKYSVDMLFYYQPINMHGTKIKKTDIDPCAQTGFNLVIGLACKKIQQMFTEICIVIIDLVRSVSTNDISHFTPYG